MAIVVEDGSGKLLANSYVDAADVDNYATDRGIASWTAATTALKQAAVLHAADYLDHSYQWEGLAMTFDQAMAWPRYGVVIEGHTLPDNVVPMAVKRAQIALAIEALSGSLLPSADRGGQVKRVKTKVDVIEEEIEYMDGAPATRSFPLVDRMLKGLFANAAGAGIGSMTLERG